MRVFGVGEWGFLGWVNRDFWGWVNGGFEGFLSVGGRILMEWFYGGFLSKFF